MRTDFSAEQPRDPDLADAERNLRACVHCGICTATCPTYVLLGDEQMPQCTQARRIFSDSAVSGSASCSRVNEVCIAIFPPTYGRD